MLLRQLVSPEVKTSDMEGYIESQLADIICALQSLAGGGRLRGWPYDAGAGFNGREPVSLGWCAAASYVMSPQPAGPRSTNRRTTVVHEAVLVASRSRLWPYRQGGRVGRRKGA